MSGSTATSCAQWPSKRAAAMGTQELTVVADRGYFKSEEILACHEAGITAIVPKTVTSNATAEGRFGKADFIYDAQEQRIPMPGRTTPDLALLNDRERAEVASLLEFALPAMFAQGPMHPQLRSGA